MIKRTSPIAVAILFLVAGCNKPSDAPKPVSENKWAEKSSFYEVTKNLDAGGSVYGYISTEKFIADARSQAGAVKAFILSLAATEAGAKTEQIEKSIDLVSKLVSKVGLTEISGAGISMVALEPGFHRSRLVLHHYPEQSKGLIWNFAGTKASAGEIVDYLPQTTAWANDFNLDLGLIWKAVETECNASPEARAMLEQVSNATLETTKLPLSQILSGLGPQLGVIVTLDPARKVTLPTGQQPVTMAEPGLALLLECNDPAVLQKIRELVTTVPGVEASESEGVNYYVMPVPLPLPYLRPALAIKGNLLVLGSFEQMVKEMFAVKSGKKPGLRSEPLFAKAAEGLSTNVAAYQVVAPIFTQTLTEIQKATAADSKNAQFLQLLQQLQGTSINRFSVAISEATPEGWIFTTHSPSAKRAGE